MLMNYLSEITRIAMEQVENQQNRNVLQTPLFILMVGITQEKRKQEILQEIQSRWTCARPYVYLCDINMHTARMHLESRNQSIMTNIRMDLSGQASEALIKKQFSWWFLQIVEHAIKSLRNLNNSRICVVSDGESEDAAWAACCCMILNSYLFKAGYPVDNRKLFCLLPQNTAFYADNLANISRNISSWRTKVPGEPMISIIKGGKLSDDLAPCNDCYATSTVFDQYVFLDEVDSKGNVVSEHERIQLMTLLMDPVIDIKWPGKPGSCYAGWVYPKYADRSIDIALGWACLHEVFQKQAEAYSAPPDLSSLQRDIIYHLKNIAVNIPNMMTGFSIYNNAALNSLEGKTIDASETEKAVFGDVLQNKFDYLWRHALNELQSAKRPEWDKIILETLSSVRSSSSLENKTPLFVNEEDAYQSVQTMRKITIDRRNMTLQNLIHTIAEVCYPSRSNQKIKEYIDDFNRTMGEKIDERILQLKRTFARAQLLQGDIHNAQMAFSIILKQNLGSVTTAIDERKERISKAIPDKLHDAYAQTMSAPDADYETQIIRCLEKLHRQFIDPENGIEPVELVQPTLGDRIMCRLIINDVSAGGTFEKITNGKDAGINYYLMELATKNILALHHKGTE